MSKETASPDPAEPTRLFVVGLTPGTTDVVTSAAAADIDQLQREQKDAYERAVTTTDNPEITPKEAARLAAELCKSLKSLMEENKIPAKKQEKLDKITERLDDIEMAGDPGVDRGIIRSTNLGIDPVRIAYIDAERILARVIDKSFEKWLQNAQETLRGEDAEMTIRSKARLFITGAIKVEDLSTEDREAIIEEIEKEHGEDVSEFLDLFALTNRQLEEVSDPNSFDNASTVLELRGNIEDRFTGGDPESGRHREGGPKRAEISMLEVMRLVQERAGIAKEAGEATIAAAEES